jgi:hypothetical protein
MAEFWRALKTLKALQAEQAANAIERPASKPAARIGGRVEPDEPKRGAARRLDYVMPASPVTGPTLHEPAAPWLPNQRATGPRRMARGIGAKGPERTRSHPEPERDERASSR